jgi:hypothetical protein
MTDRYEEGRQALDEIEAPDVWSEIERWAAAASPTTSVTDKRRRWPLAAAAAAVLVVGISVAVLAWPEDEQEVTSESEERLVPPSPEALLPGTDWALASLIVDGRRTEFSDEGELPGVSFGDDELDWSDGCNRHGGRYEFTSSVSLKLVGEVESTAVVCRGPLTAPWVAIEQVMWADSITASLESGQLLLSGGGAVMVLRPA